MGWVVLAILGGLLAVDLAIRAAAVAIMLPMFERRPPFAVESSPPDPEAEPVEIPSQGLTLRGSLYRHSAGGSRGLIVFCPEMCGDRWSAMTYCRGLWDDGFDVLAFDFRNQGDSDALPGYDPLHWVTEYEVADVLAVLRYAASRPDLAGLPLGLFGISRGGSAALAAAARLRDVNAVAAEGAFTTDGLTLYYVLRWAELYIPGWLLRRLPVWHMQGTIVLARRVSQWRRHCRYVVLERWLPRLRNRPVLLIAGGRDTYVAPEIATDLHRKIGGSHASVWIVPDARHNLARRIDADCYDQRLSAFFRDNLPVAGVRQREARPAGL